MSIFAPTFELIIRIRMKIYNLDIIESEGKVTFGESSSYDIDVKEMKKRMGRPFALLSIRRIIARKLKNFDKSILTREIGITD